MKRIITHRNLVSEWSAIQSGDDVLIEPGDYQLDSVLSLSNKHSLRITGYGALIQAVRHQPVFRFENVTDLDCCGLVAQGLGYYTQPNGSYFALFEFVRQNSWCVFTDCSAIDSGNHGFGHLRGPRTTDHFTFRNCKAVRCGNLNVTTGQKIDGAGFAVGGSWNTFDGCYTEGCLRGWELETGADGTHPMRHVALRGCTGYRNLWQHVVVMPCYSDPVIRAKLVGDITIEDCVFDGWGDDVPTPMVGDGKNVGIMWGGGSDSIIRRNTICRMRQGMGVHLSGDFAPVSNIRIEDSTIHDCDHGGYMGSNSVTPNPYAVRDVMWSGNRIRRCAYYGLRTMKGATASKDQLLAANDIAECKENLHEDELPVKPIP